MNLIVFADERKNIASQWHYMALVMVPKSRAGSLYADMCQARNDVNYQHEFRFSELNKNGTGTKLDLANKWTDLILSDGQNSRKNIYFRVIGVNNEKLDFSFFGHGSSSIGKYANIYNRFFRTALLSGCKYLFPSEPVTIEKIYHDNEGNLQNHGYFEWHCIQKIARTHKDIAFNCDRVSFVDSDHRKEQRAPTASHFIQLCDLIVGFVTYCIHETNLSNKGQFKVAEKMLPLVEAILSEPYDKTSPFGYYRKYDISHFPKSKLRMLDEDRIPGEFYKLTCSTFRDRIGGQQQLDFRY